jgi:hypothetical protein
MNIFLEHIFIKKIDRQFIFFQDPDPDPDPDVFKSWIRIRILSKIVRIRNTDIFVFLNLIYH